MKRSIVIDIDCDDLECKDCPHEGWQNNNLDTSECFLFEEITNGVRCPSCLAAEQKLRALVEEGEYMRKDYYHKDEECGWDRAVAQVMGEK